MLSAETGIAENLARLNDDISRAARAAGRQPGEITLVGASKTHSAEHVAEAVRAGVLHIGENRVQEAAAKFPRLRQLVGSAAMPTLHLVGHLQSNKAAAAVELFDRVDSVDSLRVAQALSRRAGGGAELPVLLEVYVGGDPDRPGLRPSELVDVAGQILELPGLRVEGLMSVAPLETDARDAFAHVRGLRDDLARAFPVVHFGVLSMGMSEDYVAAIHEGATEIRIGSALFGARAPRS